MILCRIQVLLTWKHRCLYLWLIVLIQFHLITSFVSISEEVDSSSLPQCGSLSQSISKPIIAVDLVSSSKTTDNPSQSIHRFFDSSPISPSGKYIGFTRIFLPVNMTLSANYYDSLVAEVVLTDLSSGEEIFVERTKAWDTQVGAHVQWGESDRQLFYNQLLSFNDQVVIRGIVYDLFTQLVEILPFSIYHVRYDGKYAVSSSLEKIRFTQVGYGVYLSSAQQNQRTTEEDGLYLIDIEQNTVQLLISLYNLSVLAGIDTLSTPTYGFHVKWSSDGQWIMFILRTLESSSSWIGRLLQRRVKVSHLFVISFDGSQGKYLWSWSSKSYYSCGKIYHLHDGNHPNWIPHSHTISMNIASTAFSTNTCSLHESCKWTLAVMDIHEIKKEGERMIRPRPIFHGSSGHPTYHGDGRYVLIDAYAKESHWFHDMIDPSFVPIRLIDTLTNCQVTLLQVKVANNKVESDKKNDRNGRSNRSGDAWRCDPHAAWSHDYRRITFNGRVNDQRQVFVAYLNDDLDSYFNQSDCAS